MLTKKCSVCGKDKPTSEFYKDSRIKSDGLYGHCKACHLGMCGNWRKGHLKEECARVKKWSKANPDKIQSKLRKYRSDPENRAKTNAWNANYKANNKAKINAINAGRRARLLQSTPPWLTPEMKRDIEFMYVIREGMKEPKKWDVDHIWPLDNKITNASGLHVPWNLRLIPKADNISKKNKIPTSLHPRQT